MYGGLFLTLQELEQSIGGLIRILRERRIALKVITGYGFDNEHNFLTDICGKHYGFSVRQNKAAFNSIEYKRLTSKFGHPTLSSYYEISVWNETGTASIFTDEWCGSWNNGVPNNIIEKIEEVMQLYREGKIHCSDCQIVTPIDDYKRHYFAGRYCNNCWSGSTGTYKNIGGWCEIERKENYE